MSTGQRIFSIDSLVGSTNYPMWKVQILDILSSLRLSHHIFGTKPPGAAATAQLVPTPAGTEGADAEGGAQTAVLAPGAAVTGWTGSIVGGIVTAPTGVADKAEWLYNNRDTLTQIRLRCAKEPFSHIQGCVMAKQAWDTLSDMYESKGLIGLVLAKRQMYRKECAEGTSIDEHIREMRTIYWSLIALGEPMTDRDFAITILMSLPISWNPFIAATNYENLRSDTLIARILEEERRVNAQGGTDTALATTKKNPNIKCYSCGKKGHISTECRSKKKKGKSGKGYGKDGGNSGGSGESSNVATDEFAWVSAEALSAEGGGNLWFADSGATSHIVKDRANFANYRATPGAFIRGCGTVPALGRGDVPIILNVDGKSHRATLRDAVHAPEMIYNLVSINRITQQGIRTITDSKSMQFLASDNKVCGIADADSGLYRMRLNPCGGRINSATALGANPSRLRTFADWHQIMGHAPIPLLRSMHAKKVVTGFKVDPDASQDGAPGCSNCIAAKQITHPFPDKSDTEYTAPGQMIVSDVCGPMSVTSVGKARYFVTFTDLYSRFTFVKFLKEKSQVPKVWEDLVRLIENIAEIRIKCLRSDNGGEYTGQRIKDFCAGKGIKQEFSAPHSPSQNGISERVNRTVNERSLAQMVARNLPKFLWDESVAHAVYIKNRVLTSAIKEPITPYERFFGDKPHIGHLYEFGSPCWMLDRSPDRSKLDKKSHECLFMGISGESKAYKVYDPVSKTIKKSRDVVFLNENKPAISSELPSPPGLEGENAPHSEPEANSRAEAPPTPKIVEVPVAPAAAPPAPVPEPRRSPRGVERLDYAKLNDPPIEDANAVVDYALMGSDVSDPKSYREAMKRSDAPKWQAAMDAEMAQLDKLGTYTKVTLPRDRKAISCTWVYRQKRNAAGETLKYKARLVARGFSQRPGFDFDEDRLYALVVRLETLRILLVMAAMFDWEIDQVDVVGAYLNGTLKEEIYMTQPEGFNDDSDSVWKLIKSLYGLKQSGQVWNSKIDQFLKSIGFTQLKSDPCVYYIVRDGHILIVALYVDDMASMTDSKPLKAWFLGQLRAEFDITELGEAQTIIGLDLLRDRKKGTLRIEQKRYIRSIIAKHAAPEGRTVSTPLDPDVKLSRIDEMGEELSHNREYQAAIGSLMYAALGSRPDIMFAVTALSQYSQKPRQAHWTAVKRVFKYLEGTADHGLTYAIGSDPDLEVQGYSDADWGADERDSKSITGYCYLIGGGAVTWSAKKQPSVARSTQQAEYQAYSAAAREALFIRSLLTELGFAPKAATTIFVDNRGAIELGKEPKFHARAKHIRISYHEVRDYIKMGDITIRYVPSAENTADILTKALPRPAHERLLELIGIAPQSRGSVGN